MYDSVERAAVSSFDHVFKLLLIGDSGVGKSSILLRFTEDEFDEDHPCTIGVDFKVKPMTIEGKTINVTIWDTAGQEKFRSLTGSYYRGTHGIILVYDVTRRESFEHLDEWLNEIEMYCTSPNVVTLLVGNKIDKGSGGARAVTREEGLAWAKNHAMVFMECSAKTKLGIQQAFEEVAHKIFEQPSLYSTKKTQSTVAISEEEPDEGGCC